jgi:hypothetical protein
MISLTAVYSLPKLSLLKELKEPQKRQTLITGYARIVGGGERLFATSPLRKFNL